MMIKVKPLSVNECWQGRRYKTKKYDDYRLTLGYLLPQKIDLEIEKIDKLELDISFGVSSMQADLDNLLKPFIDSLQLKYEFNDKQIYSIKAKKEVVKKGEEYITFNITKYGTAK